MVAHTFVVAGKIVHLSTVANKIPILCFLKKNQLSTNENTAFETAATPPLFFPPGETA